MNITIGNFYFLSDDFFTKINDPYLKLNHSTTKRPHYYAYKDTKTNLIWLIPCSSQVKKYENIIQNKISKNKPTDTIKIIKFFGKKSVLLLQDMFPVKQKFIDSQYIKGNQAVRITNPKLIKDIEDDAKQVIEMFHRGVKFTPTQPDVLRIEQLMLNEDNK